MVYRTRLYFQKTLAMIIAAIVFAGLYILVQLWQLSASLIYNEAMLSEPNEWPEISIWVAARNEEKNILNCLKSLNAIDYPKNKITVLIGNDQSTDSTKSIISDYIKNKPEFIVIDVIDNEFPTRGKARVMAQLEHLAKGDFYLVTDADVIVNQNWAKSMIRHFKQKTGVVSGTTIVKGNNMIGKLEGIDWAYFMGLLNLISFSGIPATAVGNNMAIRKAAYWETGGYSEIKFSITEDYKLYSEVVKRGWGWKNIMSPGVLAFSAPVGNWNTLLHQRKRWLKGGKELPWYWWILFGVFGIYYPTAIILAFWNPLIFIAVFFVKWLIQSITIAKIYSHSGQKPPPIFYLILYELYLYAVTILTALFFILPMKTDWKGRKY